MSIFSICGLILCACVIAKLIGRQDPDMRVLLSLSVIIISAAGYMDYFSSVADRLRELFETADINSEYVSILLRAVGICIVAQLSSDCCRDCGESALASQIEIVARVSLLVISLPLYTAVMELVTALINS